MQATGFDGGLDFVKTIWIDKEKCAFGGCRRGAGSLRGGMGNFPNCPAGNDGGLLLLSFSGGGFPLAAVRNGIRPVWASEIEAFPIEVTKLRFPEMIHGGDITKRSGAKLPPGDIICGGSPCQDCLWPVREPV